MIGDLIFTLTIGLQRNVQKREKQKEKYLLVSGTSLVNNKWTMKRSEERLGWFRLIKRKQVHIKTTTCVQSATKKKLRLQWLHAHQDWTIENWKSISWSLISFNFGSSTQMVGVKIWQEKTQKLPSLYQQLRYLLLVVERCGEDVFFLAHFVPIKYHLNCSPLRPCCKSYFQPDNAPCHNAYIIPGWFLEHSELAVLKRPLH